MNFDRDWIDEARRYLTNIVGKYGPHIQLLLGKAGGILDQIRYICPLHGPVWRKDLGYFIDKYDKWSRYEPEVKGVLIVYAPCTATRGSRPGAGRQALRTGHHRRGPVRRVQHPCVLPDCRELQVQPHRPGLRYLQSGIYPVMKSYLEDMKALNLQNRTFAIIENGSWACKSGD